MKHLFFAVALTAMVAAPAGSATPPKKAVTKTIVTKQVIKSDADAKQVEGAGTPAAALVNDCSARKFETSAVLEKNGQKRFTKLKLCSTPEADEATWVRTLEGARSKVAGIPDISVESRVKIEAELTAEINRLKAPTP